MNNMDILKALATGDTVQIFPAADVVELIEKGLVRTTNIHLPGRKMVPEGHVAINLTLAGRAEAAKPVKAPKSEKIDLPE